MKIGMSTANEPMSEELFRSYHEAGIECMELSYHRAEMDALDLDQVKQWADQYQVELRSMHLPFSNQLDISSEEETLRLQTLAYHQALMERASAAGIHLFVVHPSAEPIALDKRTVRMTNSKNSLKVLVETADRLGAVLAVEDLPRTCLGRNSDEMLELVSVDDRLMICFDTNHMLHQSLPDFVRACGRRFVTTHVSDYDFVDEKHWLPGEGEINWQELIHTLTEVGYDNAWVYEVSYGNPAKLIRERKLDPMDFARNAHELFNDLPLTVIPGQKSL